MEVLQAMQRQGVVLNAIIHNALLSAFEKGKPLEQAPEVAMAMLRRHRTWGVRAGKGGMAPKSIWRYISWGVAAAA